MEINSRFLDAFSTHPQTLSLNPFDCLAQVICHSPRLTHFTMRIGESMDPYPPCDLPVWEKYARYHSTGIDFDSGFDDAIHRLGITCSLEKELLSMRSLRFEGFVGTNKIISRCSNLEHLSMCVPNGMFPHASNKLVTTLHTLKSLRSLTFNPLILDEGDVPLGTEKPTSIIQTIGESLLALESLDLTHYALPPTPSSLVKSPLRPSTGGSFEVSRFLFGNFLSS